MREAVFRFHDELNDFFATERRDTEFPHSFLLPASIKDLIEAFGVPHPEVELILVNGVPVDFSYLVQNGDRVRVYPVSASQPVISVVQLRPQLQVFGFVGFVLDTHLGHCGKLHQPTRHE